ncbi:MAG: beta-N-acetylhexosaminidase [Bacillota bacterium]
MNVEQRLASMSLRDKVAQMVMVGFKEPQISDHARTMIADYHVGGIILFLRNFENPVQVAKLNNDLQALAEQATGLPLLISTDQEGGMVARLVQDATVFPGNMALGATRSCAYAYEAAKMSAEELRAIGVQVNFAPVLDVNNNPANPVIGVRSYGECPDLVAELGVAAVRGYQDGGVIATLKHFPGHGDTDTDSHLALAAVKHDRKRLDEVELKPFRAAIAAGAGAVMTAHVTFPAIDPTPGLPATLSQPVLTGLLREEIGFQGLIFTDCMQMKAISDNFGTAQAAVMTVKAGADCLLVCHTLEMQIQAIEGLWAAVERGEITEERIDQSVRRLLVAKEKLGLLTNSQVDLDAIPKVVGSAAHQAKAREVMEHAITLIRNEQGLLPLKLAKTDRVLVITPRAGALTIAEDKLEVASTLGKAVQARHAQVQELSYAHVTVDEETRREAVQRAQNTDLTIIGTVNANLYAGEAALVNELLSLGKPTIVLSLRNPYDLMVFPQASTYLAAYEHRDPSIEAAVACLFGEVTPEGRLPVTIPGLHQFGEGKTY